MSFSRRKEWSQNPGKFFLKMPQGDSFSNQAADYKSETQLKTRPPTDILQKPHPDLELFIHCRNIFLKYILEIYV